MTNLAHVLGLSVTAEGVETEAQRDAIVKIGCESAQGFHFAPGLTFDDLDARLRAFADVGLHLPVG